MKENRIRKIKKKLSNYCWKHDYIPSVVVKITDRKGTHHKTLWKCAKCGKEKLGK